MGLPLFIAPVTSDLAPKPAKKPNTHSSTSGIRRRQVLRPDGTPADSRDRRARRTVRIAESLRRFPSLHEDSPHRRLHPRSRPILSSPEPERPESVYLSDWQSSNGLLDNVPSLTGGDASSYSLDATQRRRLTAEEQRHASSRYWQEVHRPAPESRGARQILREPSSTVRWSQQSHSLNVPRTRVQPYQPIQDALSRINYQRASPPLGESTSQAAFIDLDRQPHRRPRSFGRNARVDGLGDRERSLSPEVWDTLLTTLTPDPQPPSNSASFASAAASSRTNSQSIYREPEPIFVPYCESGCEDSDSEESDIHVLGPSLPEGPFRLTNPMTWSDAVLDSPADHATTSSRRGNQPPRGTRRHSSGPGDSPVRPPETLHPAHDVPTPTYDPIRNTVQERPTPTTSHTESQAQSQPILNNTSASQPNSAGEEEWADMQRIMRRMAQRLDIPDEWWAEAGLQRTVSREGREDH